MVCRFELTGGLKLGECLVGPIGLGIKQAQSGVGLKLLRINRYGLVVVALGGILLAGRVLDETEIEERAGILRVLLEIEEQRSTRAVVVVGLDFILGGSKRWGDAGWFRPRE
jgi:hypothetical protein